MEQHLELFNDFFSIDLLDEIQTFIYKTTKTTQPYLGRTNMCWNDGIVGHSAPVIIIDLPPDDELCNRIKQVIRGKVNKEPSHIMFYIWTVLSYIPWHNDNHANGALTVYLNEYWDDNWGGYFMYKNNQDQITALKPETNLGVLQMGELKHCVSTININAEYRLTLQTFFK